MTETIEPTTVSIPGCGRGIVLPSGQLLDPVFASVKSLVRAGEGEYRAVIAWLEHERAENAARQADREAALAETTAKIRADAESRARNLEELKKREPWKFS
jgi:cell division inhibitor SulA